MITPVSRLIRDARVAIDLNRVADALLAIGDTDTLALDEILASRIPDAVKQVHAVAPYHLLEGGFTFADEDISWTGDEPCGSILLPSDFFRLVVFAMSDWSYPVYEALPSSDPLRGLQGSRYGGLRGTPQKPLAFLGFRPEGKTLEFFSCKSQEAEVTLASYLPLPSIDHDGGILVCPRCYEACVYTLAGLALTSLGASERAAAFNTLAQATLL